MEGDGSIPCPKSMWPWFWTARARGHGTARARADEGLADRGWTVALITSEEGPLVDAARARGIERHVVPRCGSIGYLAALTRLLRRMRPRLVHAHSGRLACLAARLAGIDRVVETRHGLPERLRPSYRFLPRPGDGRDSSRDWPAKLGCLPCGRGLADSVRGVPPERVAVIPNGIELCRGIEAETEKRRLTDRARWNPPADPGSGSSDA